MFRFSVLTFGCRVNQADSFDCERDLLAGGGVKARPAEADVVVVNTCSVTTAADQAARQSIRRIARANPRARIVVTGCYATQRPDELALLPGVVRLVPNSEKDQLAATVSERSRGLVPARVVFRPGDRGRTAFPLRVQTGCDEVCSYCTIPSSRGRSHSRPTGEVAAEALDLVSAGYRELILTGVHLGAYGRDLQPATSLVRLLEVLARLPGEFTVRVSSLEPMDCTTEIIAMVSGSARFAPHFHFPLQHASDRLLRAMRRPYRLDDYRELVSRARTAMPDAALGCDVIVGFPGETAGDHETLVEYLESSPLTHLHVFPYSDRPGTDASSMSGKIRAGVVSERCFVLREISTRLRASFEAGQVGRVRRAITIENGGRAVTDNYLKVAIPAGRPRNENIRVRILSAAPLRGEVVA
jgi:threonylcarbamoyladenosine tRNA methylthiotransferase MtaB